MSMRLTGKTALITGGSMGIGLAIAKRFALEGARVAITGIEPKELQQSTDMLQGQGYEVMSVLMDVQHKAEVDRMVDVVLDDWGSLDIVVNNAGICNPSPFLEITEEDWDQHLNVNLKGAFLVSQRAAKWWVDQGREGVIINTSSVNGLKAEGNQAHYNSSKAGMNLLTMSMALELADKGIRVNALCPGFIETRLTIPTIQNEPVHQKIMRTIPMKRVGQPEDIADAALFLASDDSRYMTGHCLVVDGGQVIKLA